MAGIVQHTADIGGRPVFWRSAPPAASAAAPPLYLHGNPTSSDDWLGFLERTGGLAPDLPGFGRSGKRGDGDYTMAGYDRFVEAFLDHVRVERVQLLVHDWGSTGLLWAQRFPERVERLVVMNAVPLLPGYRWHRIARLWRTRGVGELVMGMTTRWALGRASRGFNAAPGPMSADFLDRVWEHWDQGTQRAVLQLYRASPETALAAAGARLGAVTCPALVVWGERDPFLPARFADAYAAALGGPARVARLPDAGHWPWLDRPDVIDAVAAFFTGGEPPAGFA
jgi:pimeloyl-ACP methyl ester carboxylesterase